MPQRAVRSPLTWLGGLLIVYLGVPVAAFVIRFAGSHNRGFGAPGLGAAVRTSLISASISTLAITVLGVPLAYALARSRGRVATLMGVIVQLPLALPPLMSGILLIYLFGPYTTLGQLFHQQLTGTITGIILAQAFVSSPFLVIAARSAFSNVNPALDEVAAALGHRPLARFLRVSLPAAWSGIGAGILLAWLRSFGEYGATVLLAYHPYSLPVYTEVQFGGSGLAITQAPTAVALLIAAGAVVLGHQRWPRTAKTASSLPAPRHPSTAEPTPVSFELDVTVGTFHLQVAHQAHSHRLAILGPSGSGKSMTLRSLAGFLGPTAGSVTFGDEAVESVATERRRIGYVPQGYGLLPKRSIWRQVTFAPDADGGVAAWWLDTLHLGGLHNRLPNQLSGGQRQRVSLAQALSRGPRVVLLDEPFSALDAPVREELRREVRRLQYDTGLSTVLVTHDPEEAALLADEILVIADGHLLQAGTREQVFSKPASPQVAQLLGMQNLNRGRMVGPGELSAGPATIATTPQGLAAGTEVTWSVRPERITVTTAAAVGNGAAGPTHYPAKVVDVADLGSVTAVTVAIDGEHELLVRVTRPVDLERGSPCRVSMDPADILVWPAPSDSTAEQLAGSPAAPAAPAAPFLRSSPAVIHHEPR
jgi:molybdate transport system permease protein